MATEQGWFSEISSLWPGRVLRLQIERTIYDKRSKFQQISLYETKCCGKMLVLDGIIQFTEADEFAYQEMLTHVAMFAHPRPERILVIGGGDGGVIREVARHRSAKQIDLCEIDPEVIEVCRKYVPSMGCGFDDGRVKIHHADGSEFVKEHPGRYDVILVDSTDPIGPGEALFQEPFYRSMKQALAPGGIIATQAESFFLHEDIIRGLLSIVGDLFPTWGYCYTLVPTYPGGSIGFCVASLGPEIRKPARQPGASLLRQLRYYTPQIHEAAFVLPAFAAKAVAELNSDCGQPSAG